MNNIFLSQIKFNKFDGISESENQLIQQEITQLEVQVKKLISPQNYQKFIQNLLNTLDINVEEEELLELVVPIWVEQRNQIIPINTQIDDFYKQLELAILLSLITEFNLNQNIAHYKIKKMREIIRRYSNMPQLWLYLCKISGDTPIDAFTF